MSLAVLILDLVVAAAGGPLLIVGSVAEDDVPKPMPKQMLGLCGNQVVAGAVKTVVDPDDDFGTVERSQVLVPHVGYAHLLWAGDLDGDGELDLVIQAGEGEDTGEYILFTTRGRSPGELVHKAASARNDSHC